MGLLAGITFAPPALGVIGLGYPWFYLLPLLSFTRFFLKLAITFGFSAINYFELLKNEKVG